MKRALLFLAAGITAALTLGVSNQIWLFPVAVAAVAMIDRRAFRIFQRWKLWLFFVLIVAIPVLLVGNKDAIWLGLPYNSRMLRLNLLMVERSILLMLTIKSFTNRLSPERLSNGLKRLHLHQFDEVFRLAQGMLPELHKTVSAELNGIEWRRALRRPDGLTAGLGRLVARLVFTARRSGPAASTREGA
ncbi:MAG TPA: hypothetical protein PKI62_03200 [bacterium]|nr:hypothetical protein [bacterium]HPR89607.1 hypothetical protein [bacterium]